MVESADPRAPVCDQGLAHGAVLGAWETPTLTSRHVGAAPGDTEMLESESAPHRDQARRARAGSLESRACGGPHIPPAIDSHSPASAHPLFAQVSYAPFAAPTEPMFWYAAPST